MTLMDRYPALTDLRARARRRAPRIAWEYLDSGTGAEEALERTTAAFSRVTLTPRFFNGPRAPVLTTTALGREWAAPFALAPVGMQGMMWPGAELMLARAAREADIPYCLSTFSAASIEDVGAVAGPNGWFQLYPPEDSEIRCDLIDRAAAAGFSTLVVTVDVPWQSRRERQRRAGVGLPPAITPRLIWDVATHPAWALATLRMGRPRFASLLKYMEAEGGTDMADFVARRVRPTVTLPVMREIRARWPGKLAVKGIMAVEDADIAVDAGADCVMVSNHGGRQIDAVPAALDVLPEIAERCRGKAEVVYDSGVRGGGDVLRALALGADMAMLGRSMMWGPMALGEVGAAHGIEIVRDEIDNVMRQLGCARLAEVRERLQPL
jgi:L-lactate dehydrogenase (cytochrome)